MDTLPYRLCFVEDCDKKQYGHGLCKKHYMRVYRTGTLTTTVIVGDDLARFWNYVEKTDNCWLWRGPQDSRSYGRLRIGQKMIKAHRYSYELAKGPISDGLHVCHSCDNPLCVNPDHLWLGTHQDNMLDMAAKGRSRRSEGANNPRAKLKDSDIPEIRVLLAQGLLTKVIAAKYGVSFQTIRAIKQGIRWNHV